MSWNKFKPVLFLTNQCKLFLFSSFLLRRMILKKELTTAHRCAISQQFKSNQLIGLTLVLELKLQPKSSSVVSDHSSSLKIVNNSMWVLNWCFQAHAIVLTNLVLCKNKSTRPKGWPVTRSFARLTPIGGKKS